MSFYGKRIRRQIISKEDAGCIQTGNGKVVEYVKYSLNCGHQVTMRKTDFVQANTLMCGYCGSKRHQGVA